MRRRRGKSNASNLGEAISFEDILTVITVLLLLRIVFMVPLVNLDKAKTVKSKADRFWSQEAMQIFTHPSDSSQVNAYRAAFGLHDATISFNQVGEFIYIEAVEADSNVHVIRHHQKESTYIALHVQGQGHSRSFRRGYLLWSQSEKEWFVGTDTVDYGTHPSSTSMETVFRNWTMKVRGY